MTIDALAEPRAKRLRPRDWAALDRRLRADAAGRAHRRERDRRRPPLELIVCDGCDAELATVRSGAQAWCPACRSWSGGSAGRGMVA